jgi:LysM repeat protein
MTRFDLARGAVILALVLAPAGVWGGEVTHRLAEGETLADVAQRYWGERDWADLLRTHNHLPSGPPKAGLELRVPLPAKRTAEAGDTWASLAEATLDEAALGPLLAEMNGIEADQPPPVGREIVAPALATYRLGKGETLAAVARRFLSGTGQWKTLSRLNHLGNPHSLRAGTELRVPLHPRVAREPAAESVEPPVAAPVPETEPASLREPIREAVNAYLDGRYEDARERFEDLRTKAETAGSHEDRVLVLEYLTLVHVAFDSGTDACKAYLALRDAEPRHRWDPDRISPKVIRVTSLCPKR